MRIPETTASALVITGEVLSEGALKLLGKQRHLRKKKSTPQDIQEMLGVSVPIPQDVWDALLFQLVCPRLALPDRSGLLSTH
jgi:hypothetical protein